MVCVTVKELSTLHDRHLNRPTLDDSMTEEHAIEIQTREITQASTLHYMSKLIADITKWKIVL